MPHFPFPIPEEAIEAAYDAADAQFPSSAQGQWLRPAIEAALTAAMPFLYFAPNGDNHHNAALCPYCRENSIGIIPPRFPEGYEEPPADVDIRCQRCRGVGTISINPTGGFGLNPGNRMIEKTCSVCNGTGKVKADEKA